MVSFNQVSLAGILVREPRISVPKEGGATKHVASVYMMVPHRRTKKPEDLYIRVVLFGRRAILIHQAMHIGDPLLVHGRLCHGQFRNRQGVWTQHYWVVADTFQRLWKSPEKMSKRGAWVPKDELKRMLAHVEDPHQIPMATLEEVLGDDPLFQELVRGWEDEDRKFNAKEETDE